MEEENPYVESSFSSSRFEPKESHKPVARVIDLNTQVYSPIEDEISPAKSSYLTSPSELKESHKRIALDIDLNAPAGHDFDLNKYPEEGWWGISDVPMVRELLLNAASAASLELDLEHYVIPAPITSANSGLVYATNMTETPRSMNHRGVFSKAKASAGPSISHKDNIVPLDRPGYIKEIDAVLPDQTGISSSSSLVEPKAA